MGKRIGLGTLFAPVTTAMVCGIGVWVCWWFWEGCRRSGLVG